MLVFGFPLLYLEMILGQYARGGPITAWGVLPLMKGNATPVVLFVYILNRGCSLGIGRLYIYSLITHP